MSSTIRVGVIGAGGNTRNRHIPGLQAIKGVKIVSVCNRSPESSQRVADEFKIPDIAHHWREIVEDDQIDAVVIGTWPYMHCPVTVAALEYDKHVMVEARMAMNSLEAHQMLEAAQLTPHLVTQIVPSPFTFGFDRTIQSIIAAGTLGELLAVNLRGVANSFVNREAPFSWRQDRALSGNNIMAMGIWYEAMARWVGHATRVMAMGKTVVKTRPVAEGGRVAAISIPDHLDVLADLACGAQAHFSFSSVCGLSPHGGNQVVIHGSEGTLHLNMDTQELFVGTRASGKLEPYAVPAALRGEWRVEADFVDAIRGKAPIQYTTFEEGVRYMEFTDAVSNSLQKGEAVHLPL